MISNTKTQSGGGGRFLFFVLPSNILKHLFIPRRLRRSSPPRLRRQLGTACEGKRDNKSGRDDESTNRCDYGTNRDEQKRDDEKCFRRVYKLAILDEQRS